MFQMLITIFSGRGGLRACLVRAPSRRSSESERDPKSDPAMQGAEQHYAGEGLPGGGEGCHRRRRLPRGDVRGCPALVSPLREACAHRVERRS